MNSAKPKSKKIVLLRGGLIIAGGAERLLFEEANYLEKQGFETHILTFNFRQEVLFNRAYKVNVEEIGYTNRPSSWLLKRVCLVCNILALRRKLRQIKPDVILLTGIADCTLFYFATLFTHYSYSTHIHGTVFWFETDLIKYALVHRKAFDEIRESVIGHREFIPATMPKVNLKQRILNELFAAAMYKGVRKARKIFVLSNQMKWEVGKLYGKDAIVLKGAFPREIFDYKPKQNIKQKLGLGNKKMILNINRLDLRKRVDLVIKAFKQVSEHFDDVVLIIGGIGQDEERLRDLVEQLDLANRVRFVGFIKEENLWDYYAACEVFVHPNWADFAIAPYEALALNKKVVWSTEMEIDEHLAANKHIFAANPTVNDFAVAIEKALTTTLTTEITGQDNLRSYTWDKYCERILRELEK